MIFNCHEKHSHGGSKLPLIQALWEWREVPTCHSHGNSNHRENGHFHNNSCRNRREKCSKMTIFKPVCRDFGRISWLHLVDQFWVDCHGHNGSYKNHRDGFWLNNNAPSQLWTRCSWPNWPGALSFYKFYILSFYKFCIT